GWLASLGGRIPADYALLGVSIVASLYFLFAWTGPAIVSGLGLGATYLSLIAFNAFPSAFALATIQSEPLALALTLGAFVAHRARRFVLGALLAGAVPAIRGPGLATAAAYAVAMVVTMVHEPPLTRREWATALGAVALCGWGLAAMMGTHFVLFHDPFILMRAYEQTFGGAPSTAALGT